MTQCSLMVQPNVAMACDPRFSVVQPNVATSVACDPRFSSCYIWGCPLGSPAVQRRPLPPVPGGNASPLVQKRLVPPPPKPAPYRKPKSGPSPPPHRKNKSEPSPPPPPGHPTSGELCAASSEVLHSRVFPSTSECAHQWVEAPRVQPPPASHRV